jgi:predicted nucleic acid-binding protein
MTYLLDTNACIALIDGTPKRDAVARRSSHLMSASSTGSPV